MSGQTGLLERVKDLTLATWDKILPYVMTPKFYMGAATMAFICWIFH